jgi:hypothetical protein
MKIGFISMPLVGHINSMTATARAMQARGHDVVFLGIPAAGLEKVIRTVLFTPGYRSRAQYFEALIAKRRDLKLPPKQLNVPLRNGV